MMKAERFKYIIEDLSNPYRYAQNEIITNFNSTNTKEEATFSITIKTINENTKKVKNEKKETKEDEQ